MGALFLERRENGPPTPPHRAPSFFLWIFLHVLSSLPNVFCAELLAKVAFLQFFDPEVLQSGFGVSFLSWSGEFYQAKKRHTHTHTHTFKTYIF